MPTLNDFSCVQGDTARLCIHCEDSDGNPIDLEPIAAIVFTLKVSTQDLDSAAIFQGSLLGGDIEILGGTEDGIIQVTVPAANTATMMICRPAYWSVRLTDGEGNEFSPAFGTLLATFDAQ